MTTYLLDVNVLLSLSDPMHVHHEAAHRWFAAHDQATWATYPLTENGFVRTPVTLVIQTDRVMLRL